MTNIHQTYYHSTLDGKVFYVGYGNDYRPYAKANRSAEWMAIAEQGYKIEIAAKWPTKHDAWEHERFLIKCFRDMGHQLLNKSDGGPGRSGYMHTPEELAKMSAALKGRKLSEAKCQQIGDVWRGKTLSKEHREKMSASHKIPYKCSDCEKITTATAMSHHHKASGHSGKTSMLKEKTE